MNADEIVKRLTEIIYDNELDAEVGFSAADLIERQATAIKEMAKEVAELRSRPDALRADKAELALYEATKALAECQDDCRVYKLGDEYVTKLDAENERLRKALEEAEKALAGVIRVADRKTVEFDFARNTLANIHAAREGKVIRDARAVAIKWADPTAEDLASPEFEAVWQAIKSWDINVPGVYSGYCGATGNHVVAILNALRAMKNAKEEG